MTNNTERETSDATASSSNGGEYGKQALLGKLTLFTSTKPEVLGKVYSLDDGGKLCKKVAGNMVEGECEVLEFATKADLADLLQKVQTNQAISASVPRNNVQKARIRTKSKRREEVLARTKEDFELATQRGILVLDYDPPKEEDALSSEQLWSLLNDLCPEISEVGAVAWSSGSSYIYSNDIELHGQRGQRLYVLVEDASDIERAGDVISSRCWLRGHGRVEISKSGSLLMRSLWDEAMHEPARLDFIGGAVCMAPLSQRRGAPVLMGGEHWLDTRAALPKLTMRELALVDRNKKAAREAAQDEADTVRAKWAKARVRKETERLQNEKGVPEEKAVGMARRIVDAALGRTLQGNFAIPMPDGSSVTVTEVLDGWQKFDGVKTLDPLEPEHRNFEACGKLFLSGPTPTLYSFAHGGITYRLVRQPVRVVYAPGRQSTVADKLAQALTMHGDIFLSGGGELVQAFPGRFTVLDRPAVQYLLGHRVHLVQVKENTDAAMNIPPELVGLTTAAIGQKPDQTPPSLTSVTSLPYVTASKIIVRESGYCVQTGIYNTMQCLPRDIPETVTRQDCISALQTIFKAWSRYQWATAADRSGILAAIFTTVLRPAMAIAPGVFLDAPSQASGKTKAALALGALMTGDYVGVTPFVDGRNQEEEYSKAFIALLRSERRFLLLDNVVGRFESATIAGVITSGRVQGRILGSSKEGDFSGRIMLCATGNNATLGADLSRRFLCCRIDTGLEKPSEVAHPFEPADVARAERYDIAHAIQIILKAWFSTGEASSIKGGSDFYEWSKLVREPITWLHEQGIAVEAGIGEICDPVLALGGGESAVDPTQVGHGMLLQGLKEQYGIDRSFFVADVLKIYIAGENKSPNSIDALVRNGIDAITGGRFQNARTLAAVFSNRRERRVGGLRLVRVGENRSGALWQVRGETR